MLAAKERIIKKLDEQNENDQRILNERLTGHKAETVPDPTTEPTQTSTLFAEAASASTSQQTQQPRSASSLSSLFSSVSEWLSDALNQSNQKLKQPTIEVREGGETLTEQLY